MKKKGFVGTKVFSRKKISNDIYVLALENNLSEMLRPGQFITLNPLNQKSCMPRPFSVVYADSDTILVMIRVVGENSRLYSELKGGDKIKISGPLGQPFILKENKDYVFVAGGIGIAALLWLPITLKRECKFFYGAKTKEEEKLIREQLLDEGKLPQSVKTISEEGKNGGTAVDLLKEELKNNRGKSVIVACGPVPMLKAIAEVVEKYGNECFVSMEEIMACGGTGSCYGCVVPMKKGQPKRLCQDGPLINAAKIDFDEIKNTHVFTPLAKVSKKTRYPLKVILKGQGGRRLVLPTPVMYGSGCVDLVTLTDYSDFSRSGAIVAKGIELKPRSGNPTPRTCETSSGILNAIGLQGVGADKFIKRILPKLLKLKKKIIANISGSSIEDYAEVAKKFSKTKVAALEVNISCPNIKEGGMLFGQNGIDASMVVRAVRKAAPEKFIIVKLTPNVTNVAEIAKCVKDAGADAISLINTVAGMDINVNTRRPKLANVKGGLSGPAILPIALLKVYEVASAVNIPVIGMGGIMSGEDAAKFIMVGASAVAIGTGNFLDDKVITKTCDELLQIMKAQGANHVLDLKGSMVLN